MKELETMKHAAIKQIEAYRKLKREDGERVYSALCEVVNAIFGATTYAEIMEEVEMRELRERKAREQKKRKLLRTEITTFAQVNDLYRKGVNLCRGCVYEHYASCIEERIIACVQQRLYYLKNNEQ